MFTYEDPDDDQPLTPNEYPSPKDVYESYVDEAALKRHLDSKEWQAVVKGWKECFEGSSKVPFVSLERIAGFVHLPAPVDA